MKLHDPRTWRIWRLSDIVGIGDGAWGWLSVIAGAIGLGATVVNFTMVVSYAGTVAFDVDAIEKASRGADWLRAINYLLAGAQLLTAGMLQLGTDFGLVFAAGLAKSHYRLTPTVALVLWGICAWNTLEMKHNVYDAVRQARIASLQATADQAALASAPADVVQAKALLADYQGRQGRKPPPPQLASQATIDAGDAAIPDLQAERAEKVSARDEEAKTGRKERYDANDARVGAIDAELSSTRSSVRAARVALAERKAFDDATSKTADWDKSQVKITASNVGYDSDVSAWLRVWGASLLSLVGILVAFAANKADEDRRGGPTPRQPREPKPGGPPPRRRSGEAAGVRERSLPFFKGEAEGPTPEATPRPSTRHPDRAGDNYGPRADGHARPAPGAPASSGEDE